MSNTIRTEIMTALQWVPFLRGLSGEQLHSLARQARVRRYPRGTRLILEGTYGTTLYIVVSGEVEVFKLRHGEKVLLGREGAGSVWGEMGLLDSGLRTATVVTTRRSEVLEIDKAAFEALLETHTSVAGHMVREMNKRLRRTDSRMVESLMAMNTDLLNARRRIEETYDATLTALSAALDLRDSETEGHSQRVTEYTLAIGQTLGLQEETLKALHRGALLHDIGKIGVPDAILLKPGRLTHEERALIQYHPLWGSTLLEDIPFLRDAIPVVRHHHEWWDGSGYPDQLAGDAIPLFARIFAIADTFDALTSERPYRSALSPGEALDIMRGEVHTHLDPQLFLHFMEIFPRVIDPLYRALHQR